MKKYKCNGYITGMDLTGLMLVAFALFFVGLSFNAHVHHNADPHAEDRKIVEGQFNVLKEACIEYKQLSKDGKYPSSLIQLTRNPSITSDNAVDNRDHEPLIDKNNFYSANFFKAKARIKDGEFTDYWDTPLQYTVNEDGTAKIVSTGSGEEVSIVF